MFFTIFIVVFYLIKVTQALFHEKYMYYIIIYKYITTRGMLLLTKAKRPLKFKMLCGFNKHAVKLRMHKAAPYAFPIPLNTF